MIYTGWLENRSYKKTEVLRRIGIEKQAVKKEILNFRFLPSFPSTCDPVHCFREKAIGSSSYEGVFSLHNHLLGHVAITIDCLGFYKVVDEQNTE